MTSWEETLRELRHEFVRGSLERIARMHAQLDALRRQPDEQTTRDLMLQFHGFAGSGTTYGFPEVTRVGALGERGLKAVLDSGAAASPAELGRVADHLTRLERALGPGAPRAAEAPESDPAAVQRPRVMVVEDDAPSQTLLAARLAQAGYEVTTAASCAEAAALLAEALPDAVVADVMLPDGTAHDLLRELRASPGGDEIGALLISARAAFPDKVEAIASGADAFFEKPIDWDALLEKLQALLERWRGGPERVLVVEDFAEQAAFLQTVLEAAGYEVRVCCDPRSFEADLHASNPDLILMDILLPGISGYALTRYVRLDPAHASVPVVFLTTEAQAEARIRGLRAGGDDYLTKPVAPSLLLTTVAARLERARVLRGLMERDGLTRLLTHSAFLDRVQQAHSRALRRPEVGQALVMMDLDHFKDVNDRHGHATGDRVLAAFGAFMRRRVRQMDVAGRYGGEEFGLLLEGLSQADAARLVKRLLEEFAALEHEAPGGERFRVSFSAGVAGLDAQVTDPDGWLKAADDALYEAKRRGRNRVEPAKG
ncbi:MAG: response regulator [Vicinamibacteria bacterium]